MILPMSRTCVTGPLHTYLSRPMCILLDHTYMCFVYHHINLCIWESLTYKQAWQPVSGGSLHPILIHLDLVKVSTPRRVDRKELYSPNIWTIYYVALSGEYLTKRGQQTDIEFEHLNYIIPCTVSSPPTEPSSRRFCFYMELLEFVVDRHGQWPSFTFIAFLIYLTRQKTLPHLTWDKFFDIVLQTGITSFVKVCWIEASFELKGEWCIITCRC